jgi:starch synthase
LPGGKVGGVGDVVRDLPAALARLSWSATVVTPSYGTFARVPHSRKLGSINVWFRAGRHVVDVFEVPGSLPEVRNIVFEHALFSPLGPGKVYCAADSEGPFATDASKFAFLGAATASWIRQLGEPPDIVHLHDWHAAFYCLLRNFDPGFSCLQEIPTVFTIHNLSYQGTRPLSGDDSSLEAWFPGLDYEPALVRDPLQTHCINPLALAIRTADRISTVSPTYAQEILRPSVPDQGFIGGEGLEIQLANAARAGRLVGILNGCEYSGTEGRRPGWQRIVSAARTQVFDWLEANPVDPIHKLAAARLDALPKRRPAYVLTSIGRLVQQKVSLFLENVAGGPSAIEQIVANLGSRGVLFLLGSGEPALEQRMYDVAQRSPRLIFLRGYSETLAEPLYHAGDLFLMPSSFEPCGISQMLAMRAAQPCVVHGVGGLRDTVEDNKTGFVFEGDTPARQAANFVAAVDKALALKSNAPERWQNLRRTAAAQRFDWARSARQTIDELYQSAN